MASKDLESKLEAAKRLAAIVLTLDNAKSVSSTSGGGMSAAAKHWLDVPSIGLLLLRLLNRESRSQLTR